MAHSKQASKKVDEARRLTRIAQDPAAFRAESEALGLLPIALEVIMHAAMSGKWSCSLDVRQDMQVRQFLRQLLLSEGFSVFLTQPGIEVNWEASPEV